MNCQIRGRFIDIFHACNYFGVEANSFREGGGVGSVTEIFVNVY
jgi:hypothetical protein